jgi:hypothetical protein
MTSGFWRFDLHGCVGMLDSKVCDTLTFFRVASKHEEKGENIRTQSATISGKETVSFDWSTLIFRGA